jgi:RNA polymerase sigma factor (TIGR02999 family)
VPHDFSQRARFGHRDRTRSSRGTRAPLVPELSTLSPDAYSDLLAIANQILRSRRRPGSPQATSLVHEAYLTLARPSTKRFGTRAEFHAMVARAMRSLLVDQARKRCAQKRASGGVGVPLESVDESAGFDAHGVHDDDWIALDVAMTRLAAIDERKARIVELRFLTGLEVTEVSDLLGISCATVKRDWTLAKAWLYRELKRVESK